MRSEKFLPEEVAGKLKKLRLLILEKFESQANFAMVAGVQEDFVSRVLNGRRYLKPEERELWAQVLKTDLSVFPGPPTFRRNNDIVPNFSPGGAD
jgi:hypothetical protein